MSVLSKLWSDQKPLVIGTIACLSSTALYHIYHKFFVTKKDSKPTKSQQIWHEIFTFLGAIFSINSAFITTVSAISVLSNNYSNLANLGVAATFMVMPSIVSWFLDKYVWKRKQTESGESIWEQLKNIFTNKWMWYGVASIYGLIASNVLINLMFPGVQFTLSAEYVLEFLKKSGFKPKQLNELKNKLGEKLLLFFPFSLLQSLIAGVTINAIFGYGEERAWRDYLLTRFTELGMGFWKTSLLTGAIWGLWHYPIILQGHNYPSNPLLGVLWMTISCMLMGPTMQFFTEKANTKPLAATPAILHGVFNASFMFGGMFLKGGDEFRNCLLGTSGWLTWMIANGLIFVYNDLNKPKKKDEQ